MKSVRLTKALSTLYVSCFESNYLFKIQFGLCMFKIVFA